MNDESLFNFPTAFPVKVMGRNQPDFEPLVTGIVLNHASLFEDREVTVTESGEGNFVSVTIVIEAHSRQQLDEIYRDLTACERVLMAL